MSYQEDFYIEWYTPETVRIEDTEMARKTDGNKWDRRDRKRVKQSCRDMVVTNTSVKLLDKLQRERAKRGGK